MEDQILKAAISKYGLTQWARVASLLPKKTAKQAKARWNEYLNPSINRTEWSTQEDEKLLNLAKLLPNQWRSIASVMGRTSTHCLERYQKLLDEALGEVQNNDDNAVDASLTGSGIETLPALGNAFESLPSKPDMEEMDEDEAEMLSEAKARLANTQGKKAKRKERERLLEESRRIALVQKRRDLKAAGVNINLVLKNKKRRKEFDYNEDIPHERQPPPGLYNTSQEESQNLEDQVAFHKVVNVKGLGEPDKKQKRKAVDELRENKRVKKNLLNAAGATSDVAKYQLSKRKGLVLPEPENKSTISCGLSNAKPEISDGAIAKLSKKKLLSFLKERLANLPQPRNANPLLVPPVDFKAKDFYAAERNPTVANEERRQSIVVQKGYRIPKPELLSATPRTDSELERDIHIKFLDLVTSDYIQYVNPAYQGKVLSGLTNSEWSAIEEQVKQEQEQCSPVYYKPQELPRKQNVVDVVIDALILLDARAGVADNSLDVNFAAKDQELHDIFHQIQMQHLELATEASNEWLHKNILREETLVVSHRSARLHEMVEDIKETERRTGVY